MNSLVNMTAGRKKSNENLDWFLSRPSKILVGFPSRPKNLYDSMTPTRTIQSFIDAKKENLSPSEEVWNSLKGFRKWNEPELIGLRNASGYYPDIYFEAGMDETIAKLLAKFQERVVPHKF